jgi:hypothetical protein
LCIDDAIETVWVTAVLESAWSSLEGNGERWREMERNGQKYRKLATFWWIIALSWRSSGDLHFARQKLSIVSYSKHSELIKSP